MRNSSRTRSSVIAPFCVALALATFTSFSQHPVKAENMPIDPPFETHPQDTTATQHSVVSPTPELSLLDILYLVTLSL